MYNHKSSWQLCPIFALAIVMITTESPSGLVFDLLQKHDMKPEIDQDLDNVLGAVSQMEGSLRGASDECDDELNGGEKENNKKGKTQTRKRPSAAQYTNSQLKNWKQHTIL
jgi:hypothetical protein